MFLVHLSRAGLEYWISKNNSGIWTTVLIAGLMVLKDHALLGLGLMLSAGEVPRIAGQFGLDTNTRANIMSTLYAAQSAINMTRTVVKVVTR